MSSDHPDAVAQLPPVLELRGVSRTYPGPPPVTALHGCDLQVRRGENVAVVGPSGSGKSTLLNILGLLDRPTRGTFLLNGHATESLRERARSSLRGTSIGFVFQSFHLLPHRTALENVAMGLLYSRLGHRAAHDAAAELLDRVGLSARRDAVSTELSGGERQRVAIARALVHRPALLLCDEPTGNLDQATARSVLDLIHAVNEAGQTVVTITHDHGVARSAERILSIRDGVLQEGS